MSSIDITKESCQKIGEIVGKLCMQYPKRAEGLVKRANEIAGMYDKYVISFVAAKDNITGWDLIKVKDFISVVDDISGRISDLYIFARSKD
jgi:hypothetical protein